MYQTMNFFLEFVPMNLFTMEELRLRTVVEKGDKATSIKDSIEKTHIHFCKMCLGLKNVQRMLHREMNLADYLSIYK